jgi:hypothetical protein
VTDSPQTPGTPETPETPETPGSPEAEAVRRLLAEARHTEPMPDDVVARMDDVLAGLRETGTSGETPSAPDAAVVPLVTHRRRRAAGLLVAAAAIVVGGVAVAQHLPTSGGGSGASATAQDRVENAAPQSAGGTLGNTGSSGDAPTATPTPLVRAGRLVVRPQQFGLDALAGRRLLHDSPDTRMDAVKAAGCVVPSGSGEVLRATYRRAPAALVYRQPSGGSQVVDLYVCGSRRPVRSATLPAP